MIISIAAFDENNLIGADGGIPWKIREDMMRFTDKTMGNICAMSRPCWESISEQYRPLEGRINLVQTRNPKYLLPDDVIRMGDLPDFIHKMNLVQGYQNKHLYICGGQELYEKAMDYADFLDTTQIHRKISTVGKKNLRYFPKIDPNIWEEISRVPGVGANLPYSFVMYRRRRP